MSIATLKKKTNATYKNISSGKAQFSINGTHRSQGYIGQTSLSRSLPRTLMNGIYPRGNGGCCGTFEIKPVIQSAVTSVENPNIIKVSVISTKGMIEEKSKCLNGLNIPNVSKNLPQNNKLSNIVKPDNSKNNNDQSYYIEKKAKISMEKCDIVKEVKQKISCSNVRVEKNSCNFTKPESDYIPISQGQYLRKLNNICVKEDKQSNTIGINKTPFICG